MDTVIDIPNLNETIPSFESLIPLTRQTMLDESQNTLERISELVSSRIKELNTLITVHESQASALNNGLLGKKKGGFNINVVNVALFVVGFISLIQGTYENATQESDNDALNFSSIPVTVVCVACSVALTVMAYVYTKNATQTAAMTIAEKQYTKDVQERKELYFLQDFVNALKAFKALDPGQREDLRECKDFHNCFSQWARLRKSIRKFIHPEHILKFVVTQLGITHPLKGYHTEAFAIHGTMQAKRMHPSDSCVSQGIANSAMDGGALTYLPEEREIQQVTERIDLGDAVDLTEEKVRLNELWKKIQELTKRSFDYLSNGEVEIDNEGEIIERRDFGYQNPSSSTSESDNAVQAGGAQGQANCVITVPESIKSQFTLIETILAGQLKVKETGFDAKELEDLGKLAQAQIRKLEKEHKKQIKEHESLKSRCFNQTNLTALSIVTGVVMTAFWGVALGFGIKNLKKENDAAKRITLGFKLSGMVGLFVFAYFFNEKMNLMEKERESQDSIKNQIKEYNSLCRLIDQIYNLLKRNKDIDENETGRLIAECRQNLENLSDERLLRMGIQRPEELDKILICSLDEQNPLGRQVKEYVAARRQMEFVSYSQGDIAPQAVPVPSTTRTTTPTLLQRFLGTLPSLPSLSSDAPSGTATATATASGASQSDSENPPAPELRPTPLLRHFRVRSGTLATVDLNGPSGTGLEVLSLEGDASHEQQRTQEQIRLKQMEQKLRNLLQDDSPLILDELCQQET